MLKIMGNPVNSLTLILQLSWLPLPQAMTWTSSAQWTGSGTAHRSWCLRQTASVPDNCDGLLLGSQNIHRGKAVPPECHCHDIYDTWASLEQHTAWRMHPTPKTPADHPAWLTPVCNTGAAHWLSHCTLPKFFLEEAVHQRTNIWPQIPAQVGSSHWLTVIGLAKLLATMCSDWPS